jgi:CRISPR-associated protein Cas1
LIRQEEKVATCYLREQGAIVRKKDERLLVVKDSQTVAEIQMHDLDQLVVMGNIELTTPAIALLLQSQVDVVFMTVHGRVRGRFVANESKFAELRLKQLQVMSDEQKNLALARPIVVGKLTNQRFLITQQSRTTTNAEIRAQASATIAGIVEMTARAQSATHLDSLRGFEGKAGVYYWHAFLMLIPPGWGFRGRVYHPSTDPINALLSFGYALLQKDITAMVQLVGLDPYLGFFHAIHYGRPSLALDLMEEFRPLVVDSVVLNLVHQGIIRPADFSKTREADKPILLTDDAVERVIRAYEEYVTMPVRYPLTGEQTTYRRCFELQTRQMARVIKGETAGYQAMIVQAWGE